MSIERQKLYVKIICMLVRITEKCNMGCSHCMINASLEGEHMSMNIYKQTLEFIEYNLFPYILISGGEPTLHPDLMTMIKMAQDKNFYIMLLSNGTFLENPELKKTLLKTGITIQITNDKRFYPRRVPIVEHPNLNYEHKIRTVSPFHRALTNKIDITRQSPLCFNLRSIARNLRDFKKTIFMLRSKMYACTPSINIDGSIAAGESNQCTVFGTVFDNSTTLIGNLCSLKCGRCGLYKNLDTVHKDAIGE